MFFANAIAVLADLRRARWHAVAVLRASTSRTTPNRATPRQVAAGRGAASAHPGDLRRPLLPIPPTTPSCAETGSSADQAALR
jgi:hypothetical protein